MQEWGEKGSQSIIADCGGDHSPHPSTNTKKNPAWLQSHTRHTAPCTGPSLPLPAQAWPGHLWCPPLRVDLTMSFPTQKGQSLSQLGKCIPGLVISQSVTWLFQCSSTWWRAPRLCWNAFPSLDRLQAPERLSSAELTQNLRHQVVRLGTEVWTFPLKAALPTLLIFNSLFSFTQ